MLCLFWRPETCQSSWRRWRPDRMPVSVQRQLWLMLPLSSGLKRLCQGNPPAPLVLLTLTLPALDQTYISHFGHRSCKQGKSVFVVSFWNGSPHTDRTRLQRHAFTHRSLLLTLFSPFRCSLASLLTIALHGKLEYYTSIMKDLLVDLIDASASKNPKLMLRRTESVVEKMLTNWMSICMYSYLKVGTGENLRLIKADCRVLTPLFCHPP